MFNYCYSLSDVKPLKKWNISNSEKFKGMFSSCFNLRKGIKIKDYHNYFTIIYESEKIKLYFEKNIIKKEELQIKYMKL